MFFGCPVRGEKNGLDSMKVETCFNLHPPKAAKVSGAVALQ